MRLKRRISLFIENNMLKLTERMRHAIATSDVTQHAIVSFYGIDSGYLSDAIVNVRLFMGSYTL